MPCTTLIDVNRNVQILRSLDTQVVQGEEIDRYSCNRLEIWGKHLRLSSWKSLTKLPFLLLTFNKQRLGLISFLCLDHQQIQIGYYNIFFFKFRNQQDK